MTVLRRLVARVPGLVPRLAWITALLLAISATYVVQALVIARAVTAILGGAGVAATAGWLAATIVVVALRAGLLAHRGRVALAASGAVISALRQAVAGKLLEFGPGWIRTQRTGALQAMVVDGIEAAEPFVARFVPQCVVTIVAAAAIATYVMTLDLMVGAVVLACSVIAPVVPIASWRLIRARTEQWQVSYRALYADNLDAIQGMTTLKLLDASRRRGEQLARQAWAFCRLSTRVIAIWGPYLGAVALVVAIGSAFAAGVGSLHHAAGALSSVELVTILLLARECFRPIKDLENAYHDSWSFRSSAGSLFDLLDARGVDASRAGPPASLDRRPALAFEGVVFSYPGRARPALDDFSLTIAAGERVAVVGRSGAGKTTVASLLLRFHDPQRGRIRIGGRDITELPLDRLRSLIAVVSQTSYLFHGTIRDNLRLGRPGASDGELEAAARAAQAHAFIAALPAGYDTLVGERGLTLSGGERQRIAIARALLKDAPILVLDEATASLDGVSEAGIQRALATLAADRVTLAIAHRLSAVRDVDRVIVLDRGRIVEHGSHDALLARGGLYAQLAEAQRGGAGQRSRQRVG